MKDVSKVLAKVESTNTESALQDIRAITGDDHVLTGDALRDFRDPYWPNTWTQFDPVAVVQPASQDEIKAIVKVANHRRVPLWTCSLGNNKGYGAASPRTEGAIVVNLSRLNKVLEINTELGYAVVEPGVSFMQLYEELKAGGHPWLGPTPDLSSGSIIGNSLENGVIYGPLAADQQVFCGMEAVLANGDVVRTGMGAMPNAETSHLYKRSYGPAIDHLFLQSNFGIVTKMGVWLLPRPKTFHWFNAMVPTEADLGPMIDVLRRLRLERVIEGVPRIYNTLTVGLLLGDKTQFWPGEGNIPEAVIQEMADMLQCGRWMCHVGFWEDDAIVVRKMEICAAAFEAIGGTLVPQSWPYDDIENCPMPPDRVMAMVPETSALDVTHWPGKGIGGHTINGLVVPATGKHLCKAHDMARRIFDEKFGLDYFAVQMQINPRCVIQGSLVVYDKSDEKETEQAYEASRKLIQEGAKLGYMDYRAHVLNMDMVSGYMSYGDHALPRMLNMIKDALDPNGILSPGKQGIWPAAYR